MPKVTDPKTKKVYTSHWQTSPRNYVKETRLRCHGGWDETKVRYLLDSTYAHIQGKTRKAEFWPHGTATTGDDAAIVAVDGNAQRDPTALLPQLAAHLQKYPRDARAWAIYARLNV